LPNASRAAGFGKDWHSMADVSAAGPVSLLYRDREGRIDGIGDYCEGLESALLVAGVDARIVSWRGRGIDVNEGAVILQYNPFSFGRWGFAPRLPIDMMLLHRRRPHVRRAVMVHEAFVPIESGKTLLMGAWQRFQLRALLRAADVVMVTTSSWIGLLPSGCGAIAIPVGSNLPDRRERREQSRRALGADEDAVVLASFGSDHPSFLLDYVVGAANAVAAARGSVKLLCLGAGTRPVTGLDARVELYRPGRQSSDELATGLSACDIYLLPFSDGLSTRRTTLMAALQHGLPVVGTDGSRTEPELRREDRAIHWTAAPDPSSFADAAIDLADDAGLRHRRAVAARDLYDRAFAWDLIARRVLAVVASPLQSPLRRRSGE
jgi:glycosyltransferase involved in cell wall biosynthesis